MSFQASRLRDSDSVGGLFGDAGQGLMRMTGGWGNVSGPGIFMFRTIVAGTTSAIAIGLGASGIAAAFFGSASLPFLVCSCLGFTFGALGFYRNALVRSMIALERYPRLMQLHLDANYPDKGFLRYSRNQLRVEQFRRSWVLQSMLVCSWLTAEPALDQILDTKEQSLAVDNGQDDTVVVSESKE